MTEEERVRRSEVMLASAGNLGRWTVGALLLLNGGGMVAILQSPYALYLVKAPGFAFFIGVVAAMTGAIIAALGFLDAYAMIADPDSTEKRRNPERMSKIAIFLLACSLAAFCVGCISAWRALPPPSAETGPIGGNGAESNPKSNSRSVSG